MSEETIIDLEEKIDILMEDYELAKLEYQKTRKDMEDATARYNVARSKLIAKYNEYFKKV